MSQTAHPNQHPDTVQEELELLDIKLGVGLSYSSSRICCVFFFFFLFVLEEGWELVFPRAPLLSKEGNSERLSWGSIIPTLVVSDGWAGLYINPDRVPSEKPPSTRSQYQAISSYRSPWEFNLSQFLSPRSSRGSPFPLQSLWQSLPTQLMELGFLVDALMIVLLPVEASRIASVQNSAVYPLPRSNIVSVVLTEV